VKVIIEIPGNTSIIVFECYRDEPPSEPTDIFSRMVSELEVVHESCKGCAYENVYQKPLVCSDCINWNLWEAQDETNTN
jgi:hypothetical protein